MAIKKHKKLYSVSFKNESRKSQLQAYSSQQAKFIFWLKNIRPIQPTRGFFGVAKQLNTKVLKVL